MAADQELDLKGFEQLRNTDGGRPVIEVLHELQAKGLVYYKKGKWFVTPLEQLLNTDGGRQAVIEVLHELQAEGLVYDKGGERFVTPLGRLGFEPPPPPTED